MHSVEEKFCPSSKKVFLEVTKRHHPRTHNTDAVFLSEHILLKHVPPEHASLGHRSHQDTPRWVNYHTRTHPTRAHPTSTRKSGSVFSPEPSTPGWCIRHRTPVCSGVSTRTHQTNSGRIFNWDPTLDSPYSVIVVAYSWRLPGLCLQTLQRALVGLYGG